MVSASGKTGSRPDPKVIYHEAKLIKALKRIWFATDQMCSKKLKAALPLWLPFYEMEFEPLEKATIEKLLRASPATIDRLLKPYRALYKKGAVPPSRERCSKIRSRSRPITGMSHNQASSRPITVEYLDDAIKDMKKAIGIKEAKIITCYRPDGYKGSIYSAVAPGSPSAINLINIDTGGLEMLPSPQLLYMWRP